MSYITYTLTHKGRHTDRKDGKESVKSKASRKDTTLRDQAKNKNN